MQRHMVSQYVHGAKVTGVAVPDARTIREAAKISRGQFAKTDRRELTHTAKLGITTYAPDRTRKSAAQDQGFKPKAIEALHS